jgi:hypothetical protein
VPPLPPPALPPPQRLPPISGPNDLPAGSVVQTPQGPATITNSANGTQSFTLPGGMSGRAINNGNGTVTLISPNGSVQSVPVPR